MSKVLCNLKVNLPQLKLETIDNLTPIQNTDLSMHGIYILILEHVLKYIGCPTKWPQG